ncbi:unnamed protein product [Caenorhabditis angaria]|uniref:Uncharacterized protein n=1 Tax=Caenorhabditis angaria TaxID=860376 RepID=A0A9P1J0Y6_9PELO|nr:unnamed protein product [Caenorhabditis angaria]
MAESAEFIVLCGLFFAFWFTIHHPFLIGSIIIILLAYWIYNSPETQKTIIDVASKTFENTRNQIQTNREESEMTRSGIERARKQYMEHCNSFNSSSNPPDTESKSNSSLLFTYQVPILTNYYESIIQFFTQ